MGIFSGYMICSDIDQTLAVEGYIPPSNVKAISFFRRNGGLFTVATGRSAEYLDIFKDDFVCDKYIIACNGNVLYNTETKTADEYFLLDAKSEEAVDDVICRFKNRLVSVSYVGVNKRTTYENSPSFRTDNAYAEYNNEITKVVFVTKTPADALEIKKYFISRHDDEYTVKRTWDTGVEIWNSGSGKAQMIRMLRQKLDGIHTIICAGDFENDVQMLIESDIGYAPQNALDEVKQAADIVGVHCTQGLINQIVNELYEKLSHISSEEENDA